MKGFIEVTSLEHGYESKVSMSVRSIDYFDDYCIVQYGTTNHVCNTQVKESYEEIKRLIEGAQNNTDEEEDDDIVSPW